METQGIPMQEPTDMNPESGFHTLESAVRSLTEAATASNPQQGVQSQDSTASKSQPRDHNEPWFPWGRFKNTTVRGPTLGSSREATLSLAIHWYTLDL